MKIYNPVINNNEVNTIDNAKTATYTKGRYAFWMPYVATDPSGMGATYIAVSADNQGENGIRLTDLSSGGQSAQIYWNLGNAVDWTQDFRIQAVVYMTPGEPAYTTGDGFVLSAGGSIFSANVYASSADGALKFRLFTYNGAIDQTLNPSGASIWTGDSKRSQGKIGHSLFMSNWLKYTMEVVSDKVTGKRWATTFVEGGSYGDKWVVAAADVTSWVPGGGVCGFFCSTGGARSEHYLNSIVFETI